MMYSYDFTNIHCTLRIGDVTDPSQVVGDVGFCKPGFNGGYVDNGPSHRVLRPLLCRVHGS